MKNRSTKPLVKLKDIISDPLVLVCNEDAAEWRL